MSAKPSWWLYYSIKSLRTLVNVNEAVTFERRDSGDSSMWSSSELSISNSMPVIFPARLGCMFWISGNRRSPGGGTDTEDLRQDVINIHLGPHTERIQYTQTHTIQHTMYSDNMVLLAGDRNVIEWRAVADSYPASASVPVVEQQPA